MNWTQLNSKLTRFALAIEILAMCCGCGPSNSSLGHVTGLITYDGQPFAGAHVQFDPEGNGRPSSGYTDENGEYVMKFTENENGALIGKHSVSIRTYPEEGAAPVQIPSQYSAMEYEVKPGSNRFDVDIQANP